MAIVAATSDRTLEDVFQYYSSGFIPSICSLSTSIWEQKDMVNCEIMYEQDVTGL